VLGVQIREYLRRLVAEHPAQRQGVDLDERDRRSVRPGRGGDLEPDPTTADDDHPGTLDEHAAQRVGVLDAAQVVHARQLGTRNLQPPHHRTGCEQQLVVGQPLAGRQRDSVRPEIERLDPQIGAQLDVLRVVPGAVVHERLVTLVAPEQVSLRQRRPLVRGFGFLPDEDHPSREALGAQRLGRRRPRKARADDDEGPLIL
jgi:hypothetical protein